MLKELYKTVRADNVSSVAYMLRVPGFLNHRDPIAPCVLVDSTDRTFSLSLFGPFFEAAEEARKNEIEFAQKLRERINAQTSHDRQISKRAIAVAIILDEHREIGQRSGRDFWVVCQLVRFGLDDAKIRTLVRGRSKFVREDYTRITLESARKKVGL